MGSALLTVLKRLARLGVLLAVTAGVVWGAWYVEFRLAPETIAAITTGEAAQRPIDLPVLMYHGVNSRENRAGDYVITPEALRQDLVWLKKNGYHTVVIQDLLDYVDHGTPLPEKPVMITFDDGYYNNYLNVFPLLEELEMKAVISIIVGETDKYTESGEVSENYTHMTWDEINEMMESGLVEFQNHSYNLHKVTGQGVRKGAGKNKGESTEAYQAAIREDISRAQARFSEMTGWTPTAFTYPFGAISEESYPVLEELGFRATLDVQGRVFRLTRDPACLQRIPRFNRPWGTTAQEILEKAAKG